MNESTCKARLMKDLRTRYPHCVALRHEDRMTHGIPDVSVTMNKRTSWWEVKYAAPDFDSLGIQELTLKRLSKTGYAYYIVFETVPAGKRTYIVEPERLSEWKSSPWSWNGFNYDAVVAFIGGVHDYPQ